MRYLERTVRCSILVLGLLAWEGTPVLARPASTIFIDDSRDGVQCPGAQDVVDLFTLSPFPIADGQTLVFCSGEYNGTLFIAGVRNVTITGKVDPVLGPPRIIPKRAPGTLGTVFPDLISVQDSSNVTISDLSLDGAPRGSTTTNWNPAVTVMNGIHVVNSSVTISDDAISRIHPQTPNTEGGTGILVDGSGQGAQQITIADNTIYDFNESGITVDGVTARYQPTVTGNVIWTAFDGTTTTGVDLSNVATGTVSGNSIASTWNYVALPNCTICGTGVELGQTQHVKVSNNDISYVSEGILVGSNGSSDVVDNAISGNTILGVQRGIELFTGGPIRVTDNAISSNRLTKFDQQTSGVGINVFSFDHRESISNNTISGNTVLGYGSPDVAVKSFDIDAAHFKIKGNKVAFARTGN
jgi:hypothetical protein